MMETSPPQIAIDEAVRAAMLSPCVKSKRGCVAYRPKQYGCILVNAAYNGPPDDFACGRDDACRAICTRWCVHAEMRAVRNAVAARVGDPAKLWLVHIKAINGRGVPGGPPSCWQCSREILDAGIGGIWLWELSPADLRSVELGELPAFEASGTWKRYTALEFHEATWSHLNGR